MGTQPGNIGDERFSNWVQDTLALLYTKECLEVIADERSAVFHGQLKTAVGNNSTCTCSWQDLQIDRKQQKWVVKNCPGVCQNWLDLIISHHSNRPLPKLASRNTDPGRWPSDTWKVMKVYQSNGCQGHHSAQDADIAALIDLMRNCDHFAPLITNPSLVNQVITVRNKLMHSKDFKVENQELSHDLQSMLSFLGSLTAVTGASSLSVTELQAVQTAITQVNKLRTSILDLTLNRELQLKALKAKQVALETDMKVLEQTINDARADTAAVKSGLTDVEDKLSTEVQTLQQRLASQLSMIQDVKTGLASQQTIIQDVKKDMTSQQSMIQDVKTDMTSQQSMIQDVKTDMTSQQSMIQDVKKDMTVQQQSTATVISNLARLQQQFDVLKLDHDEVKKTTTDLKKRMSDLKVTSQQQASTITTLYHRQQDTNTELQNQQQQSQAHASQLEHHQNELDTHTAKLGQLEENQGKLDNNTDTLQDHETQLQGHQSHIESQNRTLDSHETQLQGHQSHIETQNRTLDSHETQLQVHQSHIETQNRTLDSHETQLQGHQSHLETQNRTLDSHETQLQGHQSHIESQNRALDNHETQLQVHQSHIETQNRTLDSHETQLQVHQSHIETQNRTMDSHETQLQGHQSHIESQNRTLGSHETHLQGHQSHIESQNRTLDSHETQLQGHQSHIETQNRTLDSHETKLQGHQSHIESQNRTLECHGAKLDRLENKQIAQQTDQAVDIQDLQRQLISMYKAWILHFPVYLLMSERKLRLEDIYVEQRLKVIDPDGRLGTDILIKAQDRSEADKNEQFISSLRDAFYSEGNKCQYVYVSGNAGYGKSIFCSHLVRLWCKAHSEKTTELTPDMEMMAEFPLLFCVDLRDAKYNGTVQTPDEMCCLLQKQLQLSGIALPYHYLSKLLQADAQVLVVMDGLDECKEERLPRGGKCNNCTTLVTSRPWKFEALRCDPECRVDKELEIVGLKKGSSKDLSENLVKLLNKKWNKSKNSKDFIKKIRREGLQEFLDVPVMLMSMVCLWFDDIPFGQSQVEVYRNSIHHQILAAIKAKDIPGYTCPSEVPFPICQREKCPCQFFGELLWKISELACKALLGNICMRSLVMDHDQTDVLGLTDEEVVICMKLGILTQYKLLGNVTDFEPQKSVSFTHKTYQEWFAAIYLSLKLPVSELNKLLSEAIADLDSALALDQMFLFVCGLNSEVATKLSEFIMLRVSLDSRVQEYLRSNYTSHLQLIESSLSEQKESNVSSVKGYCRSVDTLEVKKYDSIHDLLERQVLSGCHLLKSSSAARVKTYRRSHYTSHDKLIRTIQDVVVAGAVEAKKNQKWRMALQLHNVTIGWYLYMGFSTKDILACDTSHAKSVFIEDVDILESGWEKGKITPWPASSCLEKLHLRNITNAFDDTFCDNFSAAQLVHLYLDNVTMTRPQLESLCRSLASAGSLKIVVIYMLICITHRFSSMMLDLSQHERLEHLTLQSHPMDQKWGVSLCQKMDKLRKVQLGDITLTHDGLESLYRSLASAGSLRKVVIRKLTCITHKDNTHNCYIKIDVSQCSSLEKIFQLGLPRPNIKITSWPSSSRIQAVDLRHVDILSCDIIYGGLNEDNVAHMYLDDVTLSHDGLESLCGSLASAGSLRIVHINKLTCITHKDNRQDCSIMLDLSRHQGLEHLTLLNPGVGEEHGVSLCQNMDKLEKVELRNITLTHDGLESLCGSLASAGSLRIVHINKLTCITHKDNRQDCSIMLDLSRHQGLEHLTLLNPGVGEEHGLSLCQNMDTLEKVELRNITLTHVGLDSLCGSLASAGSLKTVDIRQHTCKTHTNNRRECYIQLGYSQYIRLKMFSLETKHQFDWLPNVKITLWPSSSCMQTVDLRCVDMSPCDTFCDNFMTCLDIRSQNVDIYLNDVRMNHDQLESLCGGLASAGSLRTVHIEKLTCITHKDNRQDCIIMLDLSRYQELAELTLGNVCVGEVQGVSLCQNMDKLEKVELRNITMPHDGLESLCGSLASAGSLRIVHINKLTCITHKDNRQDCSIMLDLSRHQGLEHLTLLNPGVGEEHGVSLCQNMDKIRRVMLRGFFISAAALRQTLQALPDHPVWVHLGGYWRDPPLRVRGVEEARQLLEEIRRATHTCVYNDNVEYTGDTCVVNHFLFYKK